MKVVLARTSGGPEVLECVDRPVPEPGPGEVRIRVAAIGVNYADVMCRQAVHRSMRPPPIVVGCEAAGVVEAVGPGVVRPAVGTRVGVYSPFGGAYAEHLVVPAGYALPIPAAMSFDEAAAFTHVYLTALAALTLVATPPAGARVLVTAAAGGLGGALLEVARLLGLHVIAGVGSAAKRELLRSRGVETVIDYRAAPLDREVLAATDGAGVDLAIETVGGELFARAQRALAPLGRIVIAGAASGVEPVPDVPTLLERSATCSTLNLSVVFARRIDLAHAMWSRLLDGYAGGACRARIGHRFPLHDAAAAHRLLESRASTDKILLEP